MHHTDDMDYYALLGVDRSSSPEEIARAYRRLAREYHPDLHPDSGEADVHFKQVNEAYQVLSDQEKRTRYDQQLTSSQPQWQPASPSTGYAQGEQPVDHEQTEFIQGEDIEGVVGDVTATFQQFANQAAEEMRAALRDFGAELDSISRTFADPTGNRASRRAFRPPPPPPSPPVRRPPKP